MEENVIYKVLWIDDQNLDENSKETDFFSGYQNVADGYGIDLIPFDNWEEAESALRKEFDEYSAIILDASCKIHKNDLEQEEFITAVLPSLLSLFGEKRRLLPWYILSAGTAPNFSTIVKGARYQHSKHEEDWGEMLYLKDVASGEQAPKRLFENISRVAKDLAINVVLYRHYETFTYLGRGKLIEGEARKLMLRMLSALYYPEDNIKYEYEGNPLRRVLEYLFRSARKQGLLAEECFDGDNVAVQLASLFMAGWNVRYEENGIKRQIRWGNPPPPDSKSKVGDAVFTPEIATIVNDIREFTNDDSHTSENESWYIDEERKDIFFGYVLQMCHVIRWYGKYVEKNNDPIENSKNIKLVRSTKQS